MSRPTTRWAAAALACLVSMAAWAPASALPPPIDERDTVEVWLAPPPVPGERPCAQAPADSADWTLAMTGVLLRGAMGESWGALTGRWVGAGWQPLPSSIEAWAGHCFQLRRQGQRVFQGEAVADRQPLPQDVPVGQLQTQRRHHAQVPLYCPQGHCGH